MSADYTLPPVPGHPEPRTMRWTELELKTIADYGNACAEHVRAEITPRVVEIIKERDTAIARAGEFETARSAWLAAQAINQRTIDRLRAEVDALRAGIDRAEVSYGNMLRADDKRLGGTTEYTRGWGSCLRTIAAHTQAPLATRGEGSEA